MSYREPRGPVGDGGSAGAVFVDSVQIAVLLLLASFFGDLELPCCCCCLCYHHLRPSYILKRNTSITLRQRGNAFLLGGQATYFIRTINLTGWVTSYSEHVDP